MDFNLEKTILDHDLTILSKDILEVGLDSVIEDGLLRDIPVLGTIYNLCKTGANLKERLFLKKLIHFLYTTKDVKIEDRKRTINKINLSSKYRTNLVEKLIYIIDKCDDIEKSQLIGILFKYMLLEKIDHDMFLRCSETINVTFLPDLKLFLKNPKFNSIDSIAREGLIKSGILTFNSTSGATTFGGSIHSLNFIYSDVGKCIHKYLSKITLP